MTCWYYVLNKLVLNRRNILYFITMPVLEINWENQQEEVTKYLRLLPENIETTTNDDINVKRKTRPKGQETVYLALIE